MYIVQGHALYNEKEKEFKCLVNVQDHALYYEKDLKCLVYVHCTRPCTVLWKELKCMVDVQDHALYTMKKN